MFTRKQSKTARLKQENCNAKNWLIIFTSLIFMLEIRFSVLTLRESLFLHRWEQPTFFEQIVQKKAWGSSLTGWMKRSRPFKYFSAMIVLFIILFLGLSFLFFFHLFLLLNLLWWWYLCHFCFPLSTFTWWYFSEKVCNVALSLYWLSFSWFYTSESFRDQKNKMVWLSIIF